MVEEKIKVRATASGQVLEVVVYSKRADRIEVVVGAGVHSVRGTEDDYYTMLAKFMKR